MELDKAKNKMEELLKEHGISHWTFNFDRAVRRLGQCAWIKNGIKVRTITISKVMTIGRTDKEVINTMLHEIAHALDYETRGTSGHDNIWRNIALSIGCDGNTCSDVDKELAKENYKWLAECPEHGIIGGWQRKPKDNKLCRKCKNKVIITKNEG